MTTISRYSKGGFEDRFRVTRLDGKPIRDGARYLVLDYSGADPHAVLAIYEYSKSVKDVNPKLAADLLDACFNPTKYPAQHGAGANGALNEYRKTFTAICPNNGDVIEYELTIEASFVIMAEDINAACDGAAGCPKPYHENIADLLHKRLGGLQTLVATHDGVAIKTTRGIA